MGRIAKARAARRLDQGEHDERLSRADFRLDPSEPPCASFSRTQRPRRSSVAPTRSAGSPRPSATSNKDTPRERSSSPSKPIGLSGGRRNDRTD